MILQILRESLLMPYSQRLAQLRAALRAHPDSPLDGFLVPHADRYQGEYLQPADERLTWLTGFSGSAGCAIVLQDRAALFVDGRYTLQAKKEVDESLFEILPLHGNYVADYIQKYTPQKIGYDTWLHTLRDRFDQEKTDTEFVAVSLNPIDGLWYQQPPRSVATIYSHDEQFSGTPFPEKITQIQDKMHQKNLDTIIITSPASLCWLLNIRGTDFPHTPMIDALAIVHTDRPVDFFINPLKITPEIQKHFGLYVVIHPEDQLEKTLESLKGLSVGIDPSQTPLWIVDRLNDTVCFHYTDLCALPKALKTPQEQEGFRQAHLRDGVALTKFFSWLYSTVNDPEESSVDELKAIDKLEEFRQQGELYQGPSFSTISAFADNGAIVHYRSSANTSKTIDGSSLFLLDSGGHYLDGTTDVTRTICLGEPTQEQKRHYTLVLKGHIDLALTKFPRGTAGCHLDSIARRPLWQEGLDYDHGTGHGVGHFLSVHEGPQGISKSLNPIPLQPGMILSNEPGYYREGEYGIRIENLVLVNPAEGSYERPLLTFETLTLVPLDRKLIDEDMLTFAEWEWLNAYHQQVRESLLPYLDPDTAAWLVEATQEV